MKELPLPASATTRKLRAHWAEVLLCLLSLFFYGIGADYQGDALNVINTIGPLVFSFGLFWGVGRLLRESVNNLWVPLFWYRVAMLTYFGVGALVPLYANEDTRASIREFYDFFPLDLLRLNVMLTVFHLVVIVTSAVILYVVEISRKARKERKSSISRSSLSLGGFGAIFLIIGGLANFFLILPAVLGFYDIVAIGQLNNLSMASLLGYFMLTLWSLRNKSKWLYVVFVVAGLEILLGLLEMTKFVALFPGVMIGLGFVFYKPTLRRLSIFAAAMMIAFTALAPVITYTRNTALSVYSGHASPIEVAGIYISYYFDNATGPGDNDEQEGWKRLSYVNVGAFAMNQYDAGRPGNSLRYAPIVWIPRIIYPDKPYITDISREFTYSINGNYDSSSSPGIPSEAYWDGGWIGVVLVAMFVAMTFTLWSLYTYAVIEREAWHLFFVVVIGMRTASRLDGAIVADILGPIGIAVLAHIILDLLNRFLPSQLSAMSGRKRKPFAVGRRQSLGHGSPHRPIGDAAARER